MVNDPVLSRAIIRSLEIIGEASAKVDPDFKSKYPNVEWRKMSNTRNRLIHDYSYIASRALIPIHACFKQIDQCLVPPMTAAALSLK